MKKNKIILSILSLLLGSSAFAGQSYVIPKEYENVYKSIESKSALVISNTTPNLSATSKTVAGVNVRYRCVRVDKIPCRNGQASATAAITDILLLDENDQLLNLYGHEVFVEDRGNQWAVCAGATGGYSWDTSAMSSTMDADGNVQLTYTYVPNTFNRKYHFFMSSSGATINTGSGKSHLLVDVQQKCR
jgi:hypothetical protein